MRKRISQFALFITGTLMIGYGAIRGEAATVLGRKHNLFRLKQTLHLYYYRRDRNRVISFKRASGLISRLGQLRKCDCQRILERYYQPKTMFDLKKVVRKECRRLQKLYPPYQAA